MAWRSVTKGRGREDPGERNWGLLPAAATLGDQLEVAPPPSDGAALAEVFTVTSRHPEPEPSS